MTPRIPVCPQPFAPLIPTITSRLTTPLSRHSTQPPLRHHAPDSCCQVVPPSFAGMSMVFAAGLTAGAGEGTDPGAPPPEPAPTPTNIAGDFVYSYTYFISNTLPMCVRVMHPSLITWQLLVPCTAHLTLYPIYAAYRAPHTMPAWYKDPTPLALPETPASPHLISMPSCLLISPASARPCVTPRYLGSSLSLPPSAPQSEQHPQQRRQHQWRRLLPRVGLGSRLRVCFRARVHRLAASAPSLGGSHICHVSHPHNPLL